MFLIHKNTTKNDFRNKNLAENNIHWVVNNNE